MGEGLGLEGTCWRAGLVWGPPPPPALMELCVAVLAGEEGAELEEEEEVGDEEEEESGNLDEEEMKKMQSDEVCGDSPEALLPSPLESRPVGPCPWAPGSSSPLSSLFPGHSGPGGDSVRGDVQPRQLHPAHQVPLLRVLCP